MLKTDIIKRVEQKEAERFTERINRSYCFFNYGEIRISHWVAVFAQRQLSSSQEETKKRNKVVNGFYFYCKNTVFGDDAQDIKCRKICQSENVHKIHTKVREMTRLDLLG